MENLLIWLGRAAGSVGALIAIGAVLARAAGIRWFGGFETLTLLQAGGIAMTFACLCFLAVIVQRR
jgi:hypothetical protein